MGSKHFESVSLPTACPGSRRSRSAPFLGAKTRAPRCGFWRSRATLLPFARIAPASRSRPMKLLLPATLLATLCWSETSLHFAPEAETTVKKTFENGGLLELSSAEMTFTLEGEEHEVDVDGADGMIEVSLSATFTDTYGATKDGRLQSLQRSFGTLEDSNKRSFTDPQGESTEIEEEGESALAGSTVQFTWQPDEESYKIEFAGEEELDEDLLVGLLVEADYAFLLPDPELGIEEGGTWELPALAFDQISNPGGDLKIWVDGVADEDQDEFDEKFRESLSGALECEWTKTEDGLATIKISGEISAEVVNEFELPEDVEDVPDDLEITNTIEFEFEVEGKLVWDLNKNRAQSFQIEGPLTMTNTFEQMGGGTEVRRIEVYEGTFYDRATFE